MIAITDELFSTGLLAISVGVITTVYLLQVACNQSLYEREQLAITEFKPAEINCTVASAWFNLTPLARRR